MCSDVEKICDSVFCMSLQTKVLTAIFSLPHGDFLTSWCSSEHPEKEEDGSIEYDSFATAGWVLDVFSSIELQNSPTLECTVTPISVTQASYSHQRTALFVKIIANLHCFIPTICEGLFLILWIFVTTSISACHCFVSYQWNALF